MSTRTTTVGLLTLTLLAWAGCQAGDSTVPETETFSEATASFESPHLSEQALYETTAVLASDETDGRDEGTEGSRLARAEIIARMEACGIQPAGTDGYEQPITTGAGTNVLGIIRGTDPERAHRHTILSAHYDHLGHCGGDICNGADDNAAGVAVVLGVACALAEAPPARSILVAAWDAEEPPTFMSEAMGSAYYASHPTLPLADADAAIVLDLVGGELWPGFAGHFALGSESSPTLRAAVDAAQVPAGLTALAGGLHLAEETPYGHQPWSDYDAFRDRGTPVLFLTNGQNKRYHTPSDELATLNYGKMAKQARYLASIVSGLANGHDDPVFDEQGADLLRDARVVREILEAALAPDGMADTLGLWGWSRGSLAYDLQRVSEVEAQLSELGPEAGTLDDAAVLRTATQRIMCFAGPHYHQFYCNLF